MSGSMVASFPGLVESLVHTDRIMIVFTVMNHPLTYYLYRDILVAKTCGKIIRSPAW